MPATPACMINHYASITPILGLVRAADRVPGIA